MSWDSVCSRRGVTRRGFLTVAISAIVAGVVAGVGAYYAGTLSAPVKEVAKEVTRTVTSTTTLVPGAPATTVTVIAPPTTITETVTTTITATTPTTTTPTRKVITIAMDKLGTAGGLIGTLVLDVMRSVFPTYTISPLASGGVTASTKDFVKGLAQVTYSNNVSLSLLYNREEMYKDVPEGVVLPVHTLYLTDTLNQIVTTRELKEKYRLNSWKDLNGKKVGFLTTKYDAHYIWMKIMKALGINVLHVDMDLDLLADALKKGDIVAVTYAIFSTRPAPWSENVSRKTEAVMIHPSTDEVEGVQKAGLAGATWISTQRFREAGVDVGGLDKTFGVLQLLGFNTHPKFMSEDEVYRLLKEMIARKDELAKAAAYFTKFAEDPVSMQAAALSTTPMVPAHPGLAKLLKEYGVWRSEWKEAS